MAAGINHRTHRGSLPSAHDLAVLTLSAHSLPWTLNVTPGNSGPHSSPLHCCSTPYVPQNTALSIMIEHHEWWPGSDLSTFQVSSGLTPLVVGAAGALQCKDSQQLRWLRLHLLQRRGQRCSRFLNGFWELSSASTLRPSCWTCTQPSTHPAITSPHNAKSAAKARAYQGGQVEMNPVAPAAFPPGQAFTHGSASPGYPSQVNAVDAADVVHPMAPSNARRPEWIWGCHHHGLIASCLAMLWLH